MGSDSLKRRRKAVKEVKAKLDHFPIETLETLAQVPHNWIIPEKATTVATETTPEPARFQISFDHTNLAICIFDQFDSVKASALIRLLKEVNDCEINRLGEKRIVRDNISNTAPYTSLFQRLSPDVEMKEAELPDGGRVFFFIVGYKFNIVSIESRHRNI